VERFRDPGERLDAFGGAVLATCPACGARVTVTPERGACGACAWSAEPEGRTTWWGSPVDPYLRLPLWLTAPVGDELLWAYNAAHLDLIESYVGATLRERPLERTSAMSTLAERLPPWLKSAKNRDAVLAACARLRARLP
jgi:hypothetical protein